jgi:hypothetical protein
MIRRQAGDEFFLIAQHDHAILSGQLAEHFGNARFARPAPWESVITAVRLHDCGWPLHDDEPTVNEQKFPLDVFESPRSITQKVWTASADRVAAIDAYAGLLVSLHSLSLSILATSSDTHHREKFDALQLPERFEINKFQHREVERQEQLRRRLGFRTDMPLTHGLAEPHASDEDDQLVFNFRLLQAMDLISLCLCCTEPPAHKSQEVFTAAGENSVHLKMDRGARGALLVDPWPFDIENITLTVPMRRIPGRRYRDQTDLRDTLALARVEELPIVARGA